MSTSCGGCLGDLGRGYAWDNLDGELIYLRWGEGVTLRCCFRHQGHHYSLPYRSWSVKFQRNFAENSRRIHLVIGASSFRDQKCQNDTDKYECHDTATNWSGDDGDPRWTHPTSSSITGDNFVFGHYNGTIIWAVNRTFSRLTLCWNLLALHAIGTGSSIFDSACLRVFVTPAEFQWKFRSLKKLTRRYNRRHLHKGFRKRHNFLCHHMYRPHYNTFHHHMMFLMQRHNSEWPVQKSEKEYTIQRRWMSFRKDRLHVIERMWSSQGYWVRKRVCIEDELTSSQVLLQTAPRAQGSPRCWHTPSEQTSLPLHHKLSSHDVPLLTASWTQTELTHESVVHGLSEKMWVGMTRY